MNGFSDSRRTPYLLLTGIILTLLIVFATLRWEQPASGASPATGWRVGPFTTGESFSQGFYSEVSYLSRVDIGVRGHAEDGTQVSAKFIFRLFEHGVLVRQGRLTQDNLTQAPQSISWKFAPIRNSIGGEYELQVVVEDIVGGKLLAETTTEDTHPGPIHTNGIPSGDHIDLVLNPYRDLQRLAIFWAIGDSIPFHSPGILISLLISGVCGGLGLRYVRGGGTRDPAKGYVLWCVLGLGLASLAATIPVLQFQTSLAAEYQPGFILATRGALIVIALTPWILVTIAAITRRITELRNSQLRTRLLACAAATTAIGLILLVFTDEPAYFQWIEMVEGGRPGQGRISLLDQTISASFLRVSFITWMALWILSAFKNNSTAPCSSGYK